MSASGVAPSLRAACERWPERAAITYRGATLTYGQLWERVLTLAGAYRSLRIEPGDRVVCQLPTCPEHLIAAHAAWACGAIHVGAHRDLTASELTALADRTEPAAVVVRPPAAAPDPVQALESLRAAHPETVVIPHGLAPVTSPGPAPVTSHGPAPVTSHGPAPVTSPGPDAGSLTLADLLAGRAPQPTPPAPAGRRAGGPSQETGDTALLLRTSGTTGEPKLVMESLPALWAKMAFFADAVGPRLDDVHLMYLPISHVFGLKLALMALATGGRLVLLDPFSPDEALRLVEAERVTITAGSPTHLTLLLGALDASGRRVDRLRWIATAAASLPSALVPRIYDRLSANILYVYGCSEGFLTRTTDRAEIEAGSVGSTVFDGSTATPPAPPDGRVAVLDLDRPIPLPTGQEGEIAFGAARPVRYWGQPPVATDGWYRTGDLGRLDADGRVYISGRLKEVVNRGGLKVAAGEIEVALAEHPDVADCAVVPAPDPVLGEAICACVVPAGAQPPSLADVREHLRGRLARHKLPDELCVVASIPRSSVGKVDRGAVTTLVADPGQVRERLRPPPSPHPHQDHHQDRHQP